MRIAKHGNRSVSSQCGSADVLEALGVNIQAPPAVVEQCLAEVGVAFLFAPTFHPAMKHAAQARKDLGVRTAFNLLGPLTNPARPTRQIVGVPRPGADRAARAIAVAARLGARLGRARRRRSRRAVDHRLHQGVGVARAPRSRPFTCIPADFGLAKASPESLKGGDAATNAAIVRTVLSGEAGPPARRGAAQCRRGAVCRRRRPTRSRPASRKAAAAIDSGAAADVLTQLIAVSNRAGASA